MAAALEQAEIDLRRRPETLAVEDFVRIANVLADALGDAELPASTAED